MADKREIAEKVLQTALDVVMNQRQNAHGGAENSFAVIGQYWGTYLKSKGIIPAAAPDPSAYDVAQMMTLLKIARASMGNGEHADHYIDAAGYNALAAMLADAKV
jgi:hypothetical protein